MEAWEAVYRAMLMQFLDDSPSQNVDIQERITNSILSIESQSETDFFLRFLQVD